jgi:hypothetical protein
MVLDGITSYAPETASQLITELEAINQMFPDTKAVKGAVLKITDAVEEF